MLLHAQALLAILDSPLAKSGRLKVSLSHIVHVAFSCSVTASQQAAVYIALIQCPGDCMDSCV